MVCCWIIYSYPVTNILMTEAANHILIHLSGGSDIVPLQPPSMFSQTEILKVYNILLVTLFTKCTQSSSFQRTIKVMTVSKLCQF